MAEPKGRRKVNSLRLGDVTEKIGSGATPRGGEQVYRDAGVALIRSQNVYNDGFSREGLAFIGDGHAEELSHVEVKAGDVLLNITGDSVARVCQVPEDMLPARVNQHVAIIRPRQDVLDAPFLRYFLASPMMQQHMLTLASAGGTRNALTKGMIENFRVPAFSVAEQRATAHALGSLDDKIELNRGMSETLEAIARAIFRSWFVDFDPVRAKAEGRQPFGMDEETAALFPDSFEDSPLGKIPKGWKVTPLPEAVHINPRRSLAQGPDVTYLDMKNMPTRGHRPTGWIRRPFVSGSRFTNGDTLIARITPCLENGKTGYIDFLADGEVGSGSTEFIVLRPKDPLPPEYGYCLARDEDFRLHAIQNMTGTSGRQRVPTDCFAQYSVTLPHEPVARHFGQIIHPLFARAKTNGEENATLAAIRDALLPKLIAREIRVRELEEVNCQEVKH